METLKQKIVYGYIRRIQSVLKKTDIIPTSLVWLIVSHIETRDIFVKQYWRSSITREIIHIQVGQCGNQKGIFHLQQKRKHWWINYNKYDDCFLDKIHVYFTETESMRF
eukprot:12941_1